MRYLQLPYSKTRALMDEAGAAIVKSKSPCIYGKVIKEYLQGEYLPILNHELYTKLLHEQTQYIEELEKSGLSARELLETHAYEYTVWSNIVYWLEEYNIEDVDVIKALLGSDHPLKDIQDTYEHQDHEWSSDTENAIVFCGRAKITP